MTTRTKKLLLITGLIVGLIITLLARTEAGHRDAESTYETGRPPVVTQVIAHTGVQWVIQTTCKLLTSIQ